MVHDFHRDRLATGQHHHRTGHAALAQTRGRPRRVHQVHRVAGNRVVTISRFDDELQIPPWDVGGGHCQCVTRHMNAEHEAGHARGCRVGHVVTRCAMRVRHHVHEHVAVEQPVAGPFRNPGERHHASGRHLLGDGRAPIRGRVLGVAHAVPDALDVEVEAMQVHGVCSRREVHHPPSHGVGNAVLEPFVVRPGAAVDDGQLDRRPP